MTVYELTVERTGEWNETFYMVPNHPEGPCAYKLRDNNKLELVPKGLLVRTWQIYSTGGEVIFRELPASCEQDLVARISDPNKLRNFKK